MKRYKGLSFLIAIGKWGGFHASKSDASIHICLGYVGISLFFFDLEIMLSDLVERVTNDN